MWAQDGGFEMAASRLIFVEGMTGAGKSTTAIRIAEWLQECGRSVRCCHEMDDDNPIRTRGVDVMRANHPHASRPPDLGEDGLARDASVYAVEQWAALARRAVEGDEVVVLESRYLQNSVQPRYLAGAPSSKVHEGFRKIHDQAASAEPILVYLRPEDVRGHLRRTLEERDSAWSEWLIASFSRYAWARSRGISGEEAVFCFYEDWEAIAAALFDRHRGPKLWIHDPQKHWGDTLEQIRSVIEANL